MPDERLHDPDLLDALDTVRAEPFDGFAWRVAWSGRDPLAGGRNGGRWHPPNDFAALYTSLDENGALAEIYHHLSRAPVFSSSGVRLYRLRVRTTRTLLLGTFSDLVRLGIDEAGFRRGAYARSREVGAAAGFLEADGLIVPSARWPCDNLVLFPDRLADAGELSVVETREVNWPAWREASALRRT